MTTPEHDLGASAPMTPERWRLVDTILQAALACEPSARDGFLRDACGGDEPLRREVESLLAEHRDTTNDFLAQPALSAFDTAGASTPNNGRLVAALAEALGGRYAIDREIAHGGMATVFLARDLRHGRRVAIKVMRAEVAAALGAERFLEEIRVTALLQHPHILPLFDSGSAGTLLWYVMPFIEGETLRSRLAREGHLPIDEAIRLAREIADALQHAHARGVLHRDVKPENVLLQGGHALVADFGIALALEQAGGERLTKTGLTLGTPQYMAPEQAAGERVLDARVDVYALGAVLHEMITGEPPFGSGSWQLVLQRMLQEAPAPLVTRRPDVPPWLDTVVQHALARRPADRFSSAAALAEALTVPNESTPPLAVTTPAPNAPVPAKPRRMVALHVAFVGVLAGIGSGFLGGWGLAHSGIGWWKINAPGWRDARGTAAANRAELDITAPGGSTAGLSLVLVDRKGRVQRTIPANRPWTPRFSPDGRRVAYGAYGAGRTSSDVWVTDLEADKTLRLTDDDADSNDPQWSADGSVVAYSVNAPGGKDLASRPLDGGTARTVAARPGTQFPSDWLRDGSAFLVTEQAGGGDHILVQPADGSEARTYAARSGNEKAARISPDGHWIAYTSDESGHAEVYLDSYPRPANRIMVSGDGGVDPVWRGDGRELYYWHDNRLVAVPVAAAKDGSPPTLGAPTVLFQAPYQVAENTMYDASPDGERFVIVEHR